MEMEANPLGERHGAFEIICDHLDEVLTPHATSEIVEHIDFELLPSHAGRNPVLT
jgi:hypothetical protein